MQHFRLQRLGADRRPSRRRAPWPVLAGADAPSVHTHTHPNYQTLRKCRRGVTRKTATGAAASGCEPTPLSDPGLKSVPSEPRHWQGASQRLSAWRCEHLDPLHRRPRPLRGSRQGPYFPGAVAIPQRLATRAEHQTPRPGRRPPTAAGSRPWWTAPACLR